MPRSPSRATRLRHRLEHLAFAVIWVLVAAAIALGAAGVVSGIDHDPGTDARRELTWSADRAVETELRAATDELRAVAAGMDELGVQGRGTLSALAARDFDALEAAISEGAGLVVATRDRSEALRARLEAMTAFGPGAELRLSRATRERYGTLLDATHATDGVAEGWARLTDGGLAAARLGTLLVEHDRTVAAAIDRGRAGAFEEAISGVEDANGLLDDAQELREGLANTVDVGTLDEWLRRNRAYDTALLALYRASADSPDRVTPAIRLALEAEQSAREQLPRNTNGLVIIMAEIGRGGLNQAVIAIEEARGRLAAALADLDAD